MARAPLARARSTKGWVLGAPSVAPPRQEAAEKRNFSPKAKEDGWEGGRQAGRHVARWRCDEENTRRDDGGRRGKWKRTGAEREGGGKAGRPGIDRLKKGWIFLPPEAEDPPCRRTLRVFFRTRTRLAHLGTLARNKKYKRLSFLTSDMYVLSSREFIREQRCAKENEGNREIKLERNFQISNAG